jgi:hypothetical protein
MSGSGSAKPIARNATARSGSGGGRSAARLAARIVGRFRVWSASGPRPWPLRSELAAPLSVCQSSQLAQCATGRARWRLYGDVAVRVRCTVRRTSTGAQFFGSVQAGPTFLIGPLWTMPHGVELQPGLQPCAPSGTHVRAIGDACPRHRGRPISLGYVPPGRRLSLPSQTVSDHCLDLRRPAAQGWFLTGAFT